MWTPFVNTLFVGDETLLSSEGTTQGDPLAMPSYAFATLPLIKHLGDSTDIKQSWYADDSAAVGRLESIHHWLEILTEKGPDFG